MKPHSPVPLGVLFLALGLTPTVLAGEPVRPVSVATQIGQTGGGHSYAPAYSADGRFLVFVSQANNLVINDDLNLSLDVFVHNLEAGTTVLASMNTRGHGGADADAFEPSISANGRYVVFASRAGNLVSSKTDRISDIFLRDLEAGTTTLVSASATGTGGSGDSTAPVLSADGRWVFFESQAANLVDAPGNGWSVEIFARDLQANTNCLVSLSTNGAGNFDPANLICAYNSELCDITPDGRWIAFISPSPFLVSAATSTNGDVFVRDRQAGRTLWAGTNLAGHFPAGYRAFKATLSADGRVVVFKASAVPDVPANPVFLFRHDLTSGLTTLIASNTLASTWPHLSADGGRVAYEEGVNVWVWVAPSGTNLLASMALGGEPGNGISKAPILTPDGRQVVFVSNATNLVADTANGNFQIYVRDLEASRTRLLTVNRAGSMSTADYEFSVPAMRGDGLQIAFESGDSELVEGDFNRATDLFTCDLADGAIRLVSRRDGSRPALSRSQFSGKVSGNCISTNGRYAAFITYDGASIWPEAVVQDLFTGTNSRVGVLTNRIVNVMLSGDGRYLLFTVPANYIGSVTMRLAYPTVGTVYRYSLQNQSLEQVNVNFANTGLANGHAIAGGISGDGRYISFLSAASDLVSYSAGFTNVYLRDMQLHTNLPLSVNLSGWTGNGHCSMPVLSPDLHWAAFFSQATDLTPDALPLSSSSRRLFVRDLVQNQTFLASEPGNEWYTNQPAMEPPVFSADSRWLFFMTNNTEILARDLSPNTNTVRVWPAAPDPSLKAISRLCASSNGHWLAFEYQQHPPDSGMKQILLLNRQTLATNLVTTSCYGPGNGNGHSTSPLLTADGRYLVFASRATNLVLNDTNNASDIFVYDLVSSNLMIVSLSRLTGAPAMGDSTAPALGADGRTILFQSFAGDLAEGDYNDRRDVFLLRLGAGDSDGDGLEDDWELAFFNTLARDGRGDFDGDGAADRDEYLAGTDPTNIGAVLKVFLVQSAGSGGPMLIWPAVTGKRCQVQYKEGLNDLQWRDLPGMMMVQGTTASLVATNEPASGHRFYRVVVMP